MVEKSETVETQNEDHYVPQKDIKDLVLDLETGVPTDEIESLCMSCHEQGMTRFMYTKIPMFKEIILSSFACDHCGLKNSEVQFSGKLEDTGVSYKFEVTNETALNRSVVKSEFATIRIPELEFEIPPQTQKGSINTIEGFFAKSIEGLEAMQEQRRKYDPITAGKIDDFIKKLHAYSQGEVLPFTFELDDPSGNSFIQNPNAPKADPCLQKKEFIRSKEQYVAMGYNIDEASLMSEQEKLSAEGLQAVKSMRKGEPEKAIRSTTDEQNELLAKAAAYAKRDETDKTITAQGMNFGETMDSKENKGGVYDKEEAITFPDQCYACTAEGEVRMCVATIPFFKEIIIMCFKCDSCGNKSTEIKQGGGISERATTITFDVLNPVDLNRDVFKSDSCEVKIPEIELELMPGTLGSVYTTVEGLLDKILHHLQEANPFGAGDSATNVKFIEFCEKLCALKDGKAPFTLIMDDPLSNCFIYNEKAPEEDPQIKVEIYDRTNDQNEELGINDMNV